MHFDVLVIGSGASGLAAAVSAERAGASVALASKGSIQSCNSAKAQGGIQAAFGEDDSPETTKSLPLDKLLGLDGSLADLADMPDGWVALRESPDQDWVRSKSE